MGDNNVTDQGLYKSQAWGVTSLCSAKREPGRVEGVEEVLPLCRQAPLGASAAAPVQGTMESKTVEVGARSLGVRGPCLFPEPNTQRDNAACLPGTVYS